MQSSRSPDLNIGIILAVFILSGKTPFLKERLVHNILCVIGVTIVAIIRLTLYIVNPFSAVTLFHCLLVLISCPRVA